MEPEKFRAAPPMTPGPEPMCVMPVPLMAASVLAGALERTLPALPAIAVAPAARAPPTVPASRGRNRTMAPIALTTVRSPPRVDAPARLFGMALPTAFLPTARASAARTRSSMCAPTATCSPMALIAVPGALASAGWPTPGPLDGWTRTIAFDFGAGAPAVCGFVLRAPTERRDDGDAGVDGAAHGAAARHGRREPSPAAPAAAARGSLVFAVFPAGAFQMRGRSHARRGFGRRGFLFAILLAGGGGPVCRIWRGVVGRRRAAAADCSGARERSATVPPAAGRGNSACAAMGRDGAGARSITKGPLSPAGAARATHSASSTPRPRPHHARRAPTARLTPQRRKRSRFSVVRADVSVHMDPSPSGIRTSNSSAHAIYQFGACPCGGVGFRRSGICVIAT